MISLVVFFSHICNMFYKYCAWCSERFPWGCYAVTKTFLEAFSVFLVVNAMVFNVLQNFNIYLIFNGILNAKNTSVIIYSPTSCTKTASISYFCWTQNQNFYEFRKDWPSFFFPTMVVIDVLKMYLTFFQIYFFVFCRIKKCIQVWGRE